METQQVSEGARPVNALRVPVLLVLFTAAALTEAVHCSSLSSLLGGDVWWHLSSGLWMVHNHALPHAGLFSQSPGAPWIAASWLYDLKLAIYYRLFGLRAIPIFAMFFKLGLGLITFLLAGGWRKNFWSAVTLSAIAQYVLGALAPTPVYGSVLFFGVELLLLLESRRAGNTRLLFWLPPLFLVWANVDIHFVYGLVALLLFLAAWIAESVFSFAPSALESSAPSTHGLHRGLPSSAAPRLDSFPNPVSKVLPALAAIVIACFVATLITPYFYHSWQAFFSHAFSAANAYLPDYKAPGFRQPQDYILLLLAMSAFLALGLRRSRDLFLITTLAIAAGLSFHAQRDVWLTVVVSVAVIGEMIGEKIGGQADTPERDDGPPAKSQSKVFLIAIASAIVVIIVGAAALTPRTETALLAKAAQAYPVNASNYIRQHQLPQPIFNSFEWGGFLTYYLPDYPVAIDGRTDLYGDDFVIQYSKAMNAEVRYTDFPAMANARTILLPRGAIMAQALSTLPAYKVAYSDNVATVLVVTVPSVSLTSKEEP